VCDGAAARAPARGTAAGGGPDHPPSLLAGRTDPATARALTALMDGICLQVLLTGGTYDAAYAREMLARIIG
ncbi:TetR family transcriptional regulator C-terminal domain-containing protein, partial [Streptomyces sp. NPDC059744]|uniref:TetR family transcriptional regulator C-terminal domain-containing protein n=1 Tax=Streptomyces sp. NPDC059744 TaxID=3346929 RepID=UPI0036543989